jgi:hypothetical protein
MVWNRAKSFEEAEEWDIGFWQNQTPEDRLSALAELRREAAEIEKARESYQARMREEG